MSDPKDIQTTEVVAVDPTPPEAPSPAEKPTEMEAAEKEQEIESSEAEDNSETTAPLADQIDDLQICSQSSQSDADMPSDSLDPVPEFQVPRPPPAKKALNPFAVLAAQKTTSLGLLSQYADTSDSDSSSDDSVVEIKQEYREVEIEDQSSDGESDDDSMSVHSTASARERRKKKGADEFSLKDLPPIEELQISVDEQECVELGKITSVVDQLVLVDSIPGTVPFDVDTVLFLDKGQRPLGKVFDILGQVASPLYCVRFNSNAEIKEKHIEVGATVYVAPKTEHTSFVILSEIMRFKGTDASWKGDFEAPEECIEFSDDEEERKYHQTRRQRERQNYHPSDESTGGPDGATEAGKRLRQENTGRGGGRGRGRGRGRPNYTPGNGYGRNLEQQTNPHHSWHSNFQRVPQSPYQRNNDHYHQQRNYQQHYNGPQPGTSSYMNNTNPYGMQQNHQIPPNISALLSQPPPPPPSSHQNNNNHYY